MSRLLKLTAAFILLLVITAAPCLASEPDSEAEILSEDEIFLAIQEFNEKTVIFVDIGDDQIFEYVGIRPLNLDEATFYSIYDYLTKYRLKRRFLFQGLLDVISKSINLVVQNLKADPLFSNDKSEIKKKLKTSPITVMEFGLYNDLILIDEHLIFYITLWLPGYHYKIQYDIALDSSGELHFIDNVTDYYKYVHLSRYDDYSNYNKFIVRENLDLTEGDMDDYLMLIFREREYNKFSDIPRFAPALDKGDFKLIRKEELLEESSILKVKNEKVRKYLLEENKQKKSAIDKHISCLESNYSPLEIEKTDDGLDLQFLAYEKFFAGHPGRVLSFNIFKVDLKIKATGEIVSFEKEVIKCEEAKDE